MKKTCGFILLLNFFSLGLIVPILSLLLIEKGGSLAQIAIITGLYSLTVLVLELPSGILSDIIGRKKVFILSSIITFAAFFLMLFVHSYAMLIPAAMLMGAGRAFATGSLDALMIEEYIEIHGTEKMSHVTTRIALFETVGISVGAIVGGFLPTISSSLFRTLGAYDLNLIARCIISAVLIILASVFITENPHHKKENISIKNHLLTSFRFLKGNKTVLLITLSLVFSGFFIAIIETYWQPSFKMLLSDNRLMWTIGILSFGCFLFATLGTLFSKRFVLFKQTNLINKYTISKLALFTILVAFSLQKSVLGFSFFFFVLYFIFAGSNIIESTMLNLEVPNHLRSSMLSFVSLAFQGGAMLSPLYSTFMVSNTSISNLWLILGVALIPITIFIGIALKRTKKQSQT